MSLASREKLKLRFKSEGRLLTEFLLLDLSVLALRNLFLSELRKEVGVSTEPGSQKPAWQHVRRPTPPSHVIKLIPVAPGRQKCPEKGKLESALGKESWCAPCLELVFTYNSRHGALRRLNI
jgi:hypothetical protein